MKLDGFKFNILAIFNNKTLQTSNFANIFLILQFIGKFVFTEGVGEYKNTFDLRNVMDITKQPSVPTKISGYSTSYRY